MRGPLRVECPYCCALPTVGCRVVPLYRGPFDAWSDWEERKPHAARVRAAGGEAVSMTSINREERVALHPLSTRVHLAEIKSVLVDVLDEVEAEVALRLASSDTRWAFAKVKLVVELESEP